MTGTKDTLASNTPSTTSPHSDTAAARSPSRSISRVPMVAFTRIKDIASRSSGWQVTLKSQLPVE